MIIGSTGSFATMKRSCSSLYEKARKRIGRRPAAFLRSFLRPRRRLGPPIARRPNRSRFFRARDFEEAMNYVSIVPATVFFLRAAYSSSSPENCTCLSSTFISTRRQCFILSRRLPLLLFRLEFFLAYLISFCVSLRNSNGCGTRGGGFHAEPFIHPRASNFAN